ncbi:MAG TPA: hypothetical protein VKO43_08045 [Candidatus Krumholzibacteriaceae bacterium]|nr:hypothetical protein [Candidatus Krumholzibacteriaceae bacterium]
MNSFCIFSCSVSTIIAPPTMVTNGSPANLRLLCGRDNRLEAERAYGKDFMRKYIRKE